MQAGLNKTRLNVLSSCEETDAMEDVSPMRSGSRKKKVLSLSHLAASVIVPVRLWACLSLGL